MPFDDRDRRFMERALDEARAAGAGGEVPVGAVLVDAEGAVIGVGRNGPIGRSDPTAHAEVLAIRDAGERLGAPRLPGTTLYVSLEPCLMCLGAMVHARVDRVVFGAADPLVGATVLFGMVPVGRPGLNHRIAIEGGLLAEESAALLRAFFEARRN
jgi:tRNA(adenine34) deaminase